MIDRVMMTALAGVGLVLAGFFLLTRTEDATGRKAEMAAVLAATCPHQLENEICKLWRSEQEARRELADWAEKLRQVQLQIDKAPLPQGSNGPNGKAVR